ncbi:D-glycerate dehydrogenase [Acidocella aquatica]|uniref:D-glycerate dehydrogenase n=1 Tax=Acidocella aquatica TaxID=1922313 RepID=A0ABQ6A3Z6_9PROT|nr:D-glycerate dehydrogenase [Acidocella aquatica]GLR65985.1 D-glycerate dehydrogenase [Acidocella aquatica]
MLLITRKTPPAVAMRAASEHEVRQLDLEGAFNPAMLLENLDGVDAILCTPADKFDAALIVQLPASIKVIATYSVGLEHIDLAAAAARGIKICNTPDVLSTATAELALALMLMAARRAGEGERLLRAGKWRGLSPTFHLGRGVTGKVLGIFGMGRIGRELAGMARGLEMQIHYRNRNRLPPELECGSIYHGNDSSFLGALDFLSINAPGGDETLHWLNAERIGMLKPGAVVVNTGRGSSVDDQALIAALRSGQVLAAGLDVYNNEPNIHPGYLELENAVLLPHIGSATVETRDAMGFLALDGIKNALGI